jgi:hypothetical protein
MDWGIALGCRLAPKFTANIPGNVRMFAVKIKIPVFQRTGAFGTRRPSLSQA